MAKKRPRHPRSGKPLKTLKETEQATIFDDGSVDQFQQVRQNVRNRVYQAAEGRPAMVRRPPRRRKPRRTVGRGQPRRPGRGPVRPNGRIRRRITR